MPRSRMPHPFAPPYPGGTPLAELIDRHAHLVAVGLANCRAAQALHKEITRRQLEARLAAPNPAVAGAGGNAELKIRAALLPNDDDDHYNPQEHRDADGKWTTGPDASGSKTNSPAQSTELPTTGKPDAVDTDPSVTAGIGLLLDLAGQELGDFAKAWEFFQIGDDEDAAKQMGATSDDLKQWGFQDVEEDSGTTGGKPFEQGKDMLPWAPQAAASAAERIIESAPRLAIAEVDPLLGAYAFGATPDGFDYKQAAFTLFLPAIGELTGDITKSIAARAGVGDQTVLDAIKQMGGAGGIAALIGADQLNEIWKLPPEQRKEALAQAMTNAVAMFIFGLRTKGKLNDEMQIRQARELAEARMAAGENLLEREAREGWTSPGLTAKDGVVYSETDAAADKGRGPFGVNKNYVQVEVESLKRRFPGAPETHVVQSVDELPEPYRTEVKEARARGIVRQALFDSTKNEAWLISDNLRPEDVRLTAYEEMIGHPGMEPLLKPNDYQRLYQDIRTYKPEKFAEIWRNYNVGNISDPDAQMRKIVSEYVAKEAPRLDQSDPLWQRVRDTLLRALNSAGLLPERLGGAALDARMRALARKAGDQLRATPVAGPRPDHTSGHSDESQYPQLSQTHDNKSEGQNQAVPPRNVKDRSDSDGQSSTGQ